MFTFQVNGKEYKVRYTHRILAEGDLMDSITGHSGEPKKNAVSQDIALGAEMILAGLQKYHHDEFGFFDSNEKKEKLNKVYDLFDDFEEESTEEKPQSGYTLYKLAMDELVKNGFLSQVLNSEKTDQED